MLTLGFDTSNYATSLAVYDTCSKEVVCDKKKFLPVRPGQLGLRQSDALFHHTAALPRLQAVVLNSAWFDHKKSLFPVNSAYIAPGKSNQTIFRQIHIGFVNFFF